MHETAERGNGWLSGRMECTGLRAVWRWGDTRTYLELEWKLTLFSLSLLCVTHTLAFAHTTLCVRCVLGKEEEVKKKVGNKSIQFFGISKCHGLSSYLQLRKPFLLVLGSERETWSSTCKPCTHTFPKSTRI